jgi:hypothetical protein
VSIGIRGYVGFNGGGKTLCMVEREALPSLKRGREVYANCRIGDPTIPGHWLDGAHPLHEPAQLLELSNATVLLDEITSVFPSRQTHSLPPDIQRLLNQFRKRDLTIAWSGPHWMRTDKMLREVTQSVTVCRSFFPERYARSKRGRILRYDRDGVAFVNGEPVEGKPGRRVRWPSEWRPRTVFRFSTYSASDFEEFSLNTTNRVKAVRRQWYWRRAHKAQHSYSTLEEVMLFGHLDEHGLCVRCGGSRPRRKCSCPESQNATEVPTGAAVALGLL